ncbi:MAG: hypothetical protein LUF91_03450 [Oscillospiraceae bacterium]|nr:hypothetical protein [Oscillospiraceae bacterium]
MPGMGGMGGGMGGMGGLLGGLMRGGGGMGGMNGGMGRSQTVQTTQTVTDEYDLTRWQRADGLDAPGPSMVQTVRADWEKKQDAKNERSLLRRVKSRFFRKKAKGPAAADAAAEPPRPAGGTIVMPEMKKATQRINTGAAATPARVAPPRAGRTAALRERNYLGLHCETGIEPFFTANPINSVLLAVDSLGLGALTLNQTDPSAWQTTPAGTDASAPHAFSAAASAAPTEPAPAAAVPSAAAPPAPQPAGAARANLITQRAETSYMDAFHESREQQKYNVRIRD